MSSWHVARRVLRSVAVFGVLWLANAPARGHVTLDAPDGGELLEVGSVFPIEWHVLIQHDTVKWDLYYSTTGEGGPYVAIVLGLPPGDITGGAIHTYDWTIPDDPSDEVRVRVRQRNNGQNYLDISDANLTIGDTPPECIDGDEDGYGSPGNVACPNGPEEDCDDTDLDINPGAAEVCDDTVDNDCDGFTDGDDPECSGSTIVVLQIGLTFDPADITVKPGDTIEWRHATGDHTVTSGASCTSDGRFDLALTGSNTVATYTVPLEEPDGVIPYYCIPHCGVGMTGTITVARVPVPAVSQWGMMAMTLLLLAAGTIVLTRRRAENEQKRWERKR